MTSLRNSQKGARSKQGFFVNSKTNLCDETIKETVSQKGRNRKDGNSKTPPSVRKGEKPDGDGPSTGSLLEGWEGTKVERISQKKVPESVGKTIGGGGGGWGDRK